MSLKTITRTQHPTPNECAGLRMPEQPFSYRSETGKRCLKITDGSQSWLEKRRQRLTWNRVVTYRKDVKGPRTER